MVPLPSYSRYDHKYFFWGKDVDISPEIIDSRSLIQDHRFKNVSYTRKYISFCSCLAKFFFNDYYLVLFLMPLLSNFDNRRKINHEVIMSYKQTLAGLAALIFCFSAAQTSAGPVQNIPAKVDWQVQGEWKLPASPLDVVYSLDQKHVFVLTDQHQILIYDPTGKLEGNIPVSKGVKAIDIAPRGENLYLIDSEKNTFTSLAVDFILPINIAGSPFLGKENAPVTIVEFSDFECPYCSEAVPLLEEALKKNPDTVKLVFKNMPLSAHRNAELAARAALAAKEQGKFWEFHNELFSTKNLNAQAIDAIAVKLKLDMTRFKQDIVSPKIQQELVQDLKDAEAAGVTGTPALFINGRALRNRSLPVIQGLIDDELKKVQSSH